jgi:hypothetical protein
MSRAESVAAREIVLTPAELLAQLEAWEGAILPPHVMRNARRTLDKADRAVNVHDELVRALNYLLHKPNINHILGLNCRYEGGCSCERCEYQALLLKAKGFPATLDEALAAARGEQR